MTDVVVTGLGVVAPNGLGVERCWAATLAGKSGIGRLDRYDPSGYRSRFAGLIDDFDAAEHLPNRLLPQTDRVTRLALVAADWALADAGVDTAALPPGGMGVVTTNASGGFEFTHTEMRKLWTEGPEFVSVYESFAWFYAANTGQISIRNDLRGPSTVLVTEQAGGLDVVGHARRTVRRGTPLVLTGGVESSLDPWGWVAHMASHRLSWQTDPRRSYLPFDVNADGHVPGEGGAILVVEDAARLDGRPCYGRITGYAATFDPPPGSGRRPGLFRAAESAVRDAGLTPADIDVVFADAAALPALDEVEAAALRELFGPYGVPVTAPKTMTGRLLGGGAPLDLAWALLAIRDSLVPPTVQSTDVLPEHRIDLVRDEPRAQRIDAALVLARGVGGYNSAVVLQAPTPD
ncbi:ketosynthase chain-length factor [Micromonospora cathayae]|uniref:Ketosynthase chain-length factor n=1 Tax=Micromonospora cathayae TaxID=3028804 RepID=A0ABY7ZNC0_9ACTN|nr:ketosynthase chain-length factor [Micromonospora sp. HUAS 3]WDZ83573.1 ketosynthase chain-length factor [Micromonospora sp. HUAS 3]